MRLFRTATPLIPPAPPGYTDMYPAGGGGYGEVWRARDQLGRVVAVKYLREERLGDPKAVRQFEREIRHAGKVISEYLNPSIASGTVEGRPYIVSAWINFPTLQSAAPLHDHRLSAVAKALAVGVHDMAANKLMHLDLKPANVMLNGGSAIIIDHGSSASVESTGVSASHTPGWAAPERLTAPTFASDVWAAAATIAFAATGHNPFETHKGQPGREVQLAINAGAAPDLAGVPDGLASILRRALASDPAGRPSPKEFRSSVLAYISSAGHFAQPGSDGPSLPAAEDTLPTATLSPVQSEEPSRRRSTGMVIVALSVLAVIATAGLFNALSPAPEDAPVADDAAEQDAPENPRQDDEQPSNDDTPEATAVADTPDAEPDDTADPATASGNAQTDSGGDQVVSMQEVEALPPTTSSPGFGQEARARTGQIDIDGQEWTGVIHEFNDTQFSDDTQSVRSGWNLSGDYRRARGLIGMPEDSIWFEGIEFDVLVDGERVESGNVRRGHPALIDVDVEGALSLEVITFTDDKSTRRHPIYAGIAGWQFAEDDFPEPFTAQYQPSRLTTGQAVGMFDVERLDSVIGDSGVFASTASREEQAPLGGEDRLSLVHTHDIERFNPSEDYFAAEGWNLARDFSRATGQIGLADNGGWADGATFELIGDGNMLQSGELTRGSPTPVDLDVSGIATLRLITRPTTNNNDGPPRIAVTYLEFVAA